MLKVISAFGLPIGGCTESEAKCKNNLPCWYYKNYSTEISHALFLLKTEEEKNTINMLIDNS